MFKKQLRTLVDYNLGITSTFSYVPKSYDTCTSSKVVVFATLSWWEAAHDAMKMLVKLTSAKNIMHKSTKLMTKCLHLFTTLWFLRIYLQRTSFVQLSRCTFSFGQLRSRMFMLSSIWASNPCNSKPLHFDVANLDFWNSIHHNKCFDRSSLTATKSAILVNATHNCSYLCCSTV